MTGQPIWRERLQGVGVITPTEAIALGATGPILRSTGVDWDLRRDMPYLHYPELEFDVIVGSYGDAFDRYAIRLNEIRESMRIVRQILDRMPPGDYRIQDKKVTPPPRARIDESMEALIHHFKLFTEGFKVPEGEVYVAVESPRGELGCYLVSDGSATPYRMHIRGAVVRQHPVPAAHDARRPRRRRRGGHLLGRPGPRGGRPVTWRGSPTPTCSIAKEIIGRYPRPKSALIPLLHLAQEQDGYVTDDGDGPHRRAARHHAGRRLRHGVVLRDVQVRAGRAVLHQRLHEHLLPAARRVGAARARRAPPRRHGRAATTDDGMFTLEDVECIAACTEAPALQVNYRYRYQVSHDDFDQLVDDLAAGRLDDEIPPFGTLARVRQRTTDRWAGTGAAAQAKVDAR